jgi:hypothetical protein
MNHNAYGDAVFNTKGTKVTQWSQRKLFGQEEREGTEKFKSVFLRFLCFLLFQFVRLRNQIRVQTI